MHIAVPSTYLIDTCVLQPEEHRKVEVAHYGCGDEIGKVDDNELCPKGVIFFGNTQDGNG